MGEGATGEDVMGEGVMPIGEGAMGEGVVGVRGRHVITLAGSVYLLGEY